MKTVTAGVTIAVTAALIVSAGIAVSTLRVHGVIIENHTNRHEWALAQMRRNEERIGKTEGEVKVGVAILGQIEQRLKNIEAKLP